MQPKLYLLPNFLTENGDVSYLCSAEILCIRSLNYFITESRSSLFSLLKKTGHPAPDTVEWEEFNEHHLHPSDEIVQWFRKKVSLGLVSDAGLPSMGDPGFHIVRLAHRHQYEIIPLPGPGAIYMAVMASGLNSQSFVFHGYLPREEKSLMTKFGDIKQHILKTNYAHFFIETPYRNLRLKEKILNFFPEEWFLMFAMNITSKDETILLKNISEWKNMNVSFLHKKPVVFGIGR